MKLYGVLKSRASRNAWLLGELGVPFEQIPVTQVYRLKDATAPNAPFHTGSAEFRAVNPNGLIPTLDDDGFVLHESLAINLYLAKKYGGPLAPKDAHEDGLMTMWALWAATTVEAHSLALLMHSAQLPENERDPAVVTASRDALQRPFAVLDAAVKDGGGYLVGHRFTVADINTAEVCRYAQRAPDLIAAFPNLKAWLDACQARPAFKAMWAKRDAEPEPV